MANTQPIFMRKEVGALPATLTPNTQYFVRTGEGFDLYLSDATGTVAHKVNAGVQQVFVSETPDISHPAISFAATTIGDQEVFEMKVNT